MLAIAAIVTVKSVNTKSGMSSLMTQNIEALTQNEGPISGSILCEGSGHLYCPLNQLSAYSLIIYDQN